MDSFNFRTFLSDVFPGADFFVSHGDTDEKIIYKPCLYRARVHGGTCFHSSDCEKRQHDKTCAETPISALLVVLAVAVFGIYSMFVWRMELMPEMDMPM
jgi:hypothetical protein